MARPPTIKGTKLLIQIGDGADPENFAHPCLINADRNIAFSANTTNNFVPDCDDPEATPWDEPEKTSKSWTTGGSGVLDTRLTEEWFDFLNSDDPKNVRILVNATAANGGGYFEGPMHCTAFELTGSNEGGKVNCSLSLVGVGEPNWVDLT